jgi:uncharacterized protein involved in exopolysaccharide biosynthesis
MQTKSDRIGITDLLYRLQLLTRYLKKHWYVLVIAIFAGGAIGVGYVWLQPPVYEAKCSFAIDEKNAGLGGALGFAVELGLNFGSGGRDVFSGENIIYIMQSKRIIEQVLLTVDTINGKAHTIADWYLLHTKAKGKSINNYRAVFSPQISRNKFTYIQDSILSEIYQQIAKSKLSIGKPDKKYNIYEVSFESPNERLSKLFAERLMEAAGNYYTDIKTTRSKRNFEILDARVAAMRNRASSAIQDDAGEKDANLNPAFAKALARSAEKQIDMTAYGRAYEELFRNLEIARYQYLNDVPLIQVIDAPSLPIKNKKMGRFKGGLIGGFLLGSLALLLLAISCFLSIKTEQPS